MRLSDNCTAMRRIVYTGLVLTLLGACTTGGKEGEAGNTGFTKKYRCDEGKELTVEYDNSDPEKALAYVQLTPENPEKIKMTISMSASGARYTDGKLVWWTKGDTGYLTEEGDTGVFLYNNCSEFKETP